MIAEVDRAWLSGFIDGEGYVGLYPAHNKDDNKSYWTAGVGFRHTHLLTMEHVLELLDTAEVTHYQLKVERRSSNNPNHKDSYHFKVGAQSEILKLGLLVRPYTITKTHQWDVVMEWCTSRLNGARVGTNRPYTGRELELGLIGSTMNRRGK